MRKSDLKQLAGLGAMILDLRLADLQQAKAARDKTADQIANLQAARAEEGIALVAAELAALRYEGWADARRRELNLVLARQTAQMLTAQDQARSAFGRVDVLRRLQTGPR